MNIRQSLAILHLMFAGICGSVIVDPDPCTNAVDIGSFKRSTSYVSKSNEALQDDSRLESNKWFKFSSCTGSKMPESCVSVFHCGTFAPVWLNGVHPTSENPGPKKVQVCAMYYDGTCCGWRSQIGVKRCEDSSGQEYFVYQLSATPEFVAYCAGNGLLCNNGSTWNAINSTCTVVPLVISNVVLSEPYISATKEVRTPSGSPLNATRFSVNCSIGYPKQTVDDGVRFRVLFQGDGITLANFTANSTHPNVVLDESYLRGFIGRTLTCVVQPFLASSPCDSHLVTTTSKYYLSNGIWIGIQPVTSAGVVTTAQLQRGQNFTFRMQATFPITFAHCFDSPEPCRPSYQFQMSATRQKATDCTLILTPSLNPSNQITVSSMTVSVGPSNIVGQIKFLNVTDSTATIFSGYTIQNIEIQMLDFKPQPYCISSGDPHIRAFGTSEYYDTFSVGDFYLLKAKSWMFEVQVRHVPCTVSQPATCNCGVIVREGNNILGINACDSQISPLLIRYLIDANSPSGTIEFTTNSWTINLISGIKLIATPWINNFGTTSFDVEVYGLDKDEYEGLCAHKSADAKQFQVPWNESFFQMSSKNPPKCHSVSSTLPTCNCSGKTTTGSTVYNIACDPTQAENLQLLPVLQTNYQCSSSSRKKRSVTSNSMYTVDLDAINSKMNHSLDGTTYSVNVSWPTESGITRQVAVDQCNASLRSSPAYQICQEIFDLDPLINTCVLDIQMTDNLNSARHASGQMESICTYTIQSQIVESDNQTDNTSLDMINKLQQVRNVTCPYQCVRGTCFNQTCSCDQGFLGADCSVAEGQQPVLNEVIFSHCDVHQSSCQTVYLSASNVLDSPDLVCRIKPLGVCNGEFAKEQTLNASHVPFGPVICSTLNSPVNSMLANLATIFIVEVSITNDQTGWSNSLTYTIYDSHCWECSNDGCQMKTNISDPIEYQRCYFSYFGTLCDFHNTSYCSIGNCTNHCWTETLDSYAPGGIVQLSARTLLECQSQCFSSLTTSCAFGFDWNPSNGVGDQCFFSTSSYVSIGTYQGVSHFRYTCRSESTILVTTPISTASPTYGCWQEYENSNSPGGLVQPTLTTLFACRAQCYQTSCLGFDWNPQNSFNEQCWFSIYETFNQNSYPGCTHFQSILCPSGF